MLRTGDYNLKRGGAFASVPSYRHYFRNTRVLRRGRNSQNDSRWQPSCKFFLISFCTVLLITFMIYITSSASKYTHHWKWRLSDNDNIKKYNSLQTSLEQWLKKYPLIEPHRAHDGFNCDSWNCESTYNLHKNEWIEPRKEYKILLPNNKVYYEWMERHSSQNEQLINLKQECEWIFIGDSISYSWNYKQNIYNKYFNKNNNAIIYAQSGDKIHEIGWRLDNKYGGNGFQHIQQCLDKTNHNKQKSIILLIGTNDIGSGTKYNIILKDFMILLDQFTQFIQQKQNENVMLYLIGIFPRGQTYISFNDRMQRKNEIKTNEEWNPGNKYFYSINFINDYLNEYANNNNYYFNDRIKYIDCQNYFLSHKNIIEFKDNDGNLHEYQTGTITIDIMDDMLHLTEKGYEKWSQCILQQTKISTH